MCCARHCKETPRSLDSAGSSCSPDVPVGAPPRHPAVRSFVETSLLVTSAIKRCTCFLLFCYTAWLCLLVCLCWCMHVAKQSWTNGVSAHCWTLRHCDITAEGGSERTAEQQKRDEKGTTCEQAPREARGGTAAGTAAGTGARAGATRAGRKRGKRARWRDVLAHRSDVGTRRDQKAARNTPGLCGQTKPTNNRASQQRMTKQ